MTEALTSASCKAGEYQYDSMVGRLRGHTHNGVVQQLVRYIVLRRLHALRHRQLRYIVLVIAPPARLDVRVQHTRFANREAHGQ